jgi:Glutathione S-transferase, N-terminal domain
MSSSIGRIDATSTVPSPPVFQLMRRGGSSSFIHPGGHNLPAPRCVEPCNGCASRRGGCRKPTMLELYTWKTPNGRKVPILLAELDWPCVLYLINLGENEQKSPEFLAKNPNGKIPALVDDDVVVFESGAILEYLADKSGSPEFSMGTFATASGSRATTRSPTSSTIPGSMPSPTPRRTSPTGSSWMVAIASLPLRQPRLRSPAPRCLRPGSLPARPAPTVDKTSMHRSARRCC